jgi:hypothetical protein
MAVPTDGGDSASLRQLQWYGNKIDPLLALWNETIDPQATSVYWIVIPRLTAIIRHAEQMAMPDALHKTHQLLLGALIPWGGGLRRVSDGRIRRHDCQRENRCEISDERL